MMSTPRRAGRVQDKAICEYRENTLDQTDRRGDRRGVATMLVIAADDSRKGFGLISLVVGSRVQSFSAWPCRGETSSFVTVDHLSMTSLPYL